MFNRIFLILSFATILLGCSKKVVPGKYKSKDGTQVIIINDDNTYIYSSNEHHLLLFSSGKIERSKNSIFYLNSLFKDTCLHFEYNEKLNEKPLNNLNINLETIGGSEKADYRVVFFDQEYNDFKDLRGDSLNNILFPSTIENFSFAIVKKPLNSRSNRKYLSFSSGSYNFGKIPKEINISISLNDTIFSNRFFSFKDQIKFRSKGLKLNDSKFKKSIFFKRERI